MPRFTTNLATPEDTADRIVTVEYDVDPGEPASWDSPGCADTVSIIRVTDEAGADVTLTPEQTAEVESAALWDWEYEEAVEAGLRADMANDEARL